MTPVSGRHPKNKIYFLFVLMSHKTFLCEVITFDVDVSREHHMIINTVHCHHFFLKNFVNKLIFLIPLQHYKHLLFLLKYQIFMLEVGFEQRDSLGSCFLRCKITSLSLEKICNGIFVYSQSQISPCAIKKILSEFNLAII